MGNCLHLSHTKCENEDPDNIELNDINKADQNTIENSNNQRNLAQSISYSNSNTNQLHSTESDDFQKMMQNLQRHKRSISRFKEQQLKASGLSSNEEIIPINNSINSQHSNSAHFFNAGSNIADKMIQSRRRHKRTISKFKEEQLKYINTEIKQNEQNHNYAKIEANDTQVTPHTFKSVYNEGWIQVYDYDSNQWQNQWMVLNNELLQFFVDQNKYQLLTHYNLRQYASLFKSVSSFTIYKNPLEEIKCRIVGNNFEQFNLWIMNIQESIHMYGKQFDHKVTPENSIQTHFPYDIGNELKVKYIQNIDNELTDENISLIIFDGSNDVDEGHFIVETPNGDTISEFETDIVIHIYINQNDIITLQTEQWEELKIKNRIMNNDEYNIDKSLSDIADWCVKYKDNYKAKNKTFMIDLSNFLNIPFVKSTENNKVNALLEAIGEKKNYIDHINKDNHQKMNDDQWLCSKCTFFNSIILSYCEMCQQPRT